MNQMLPRYLAHKDFDASIEAAHAEGRWLTTRPMANEERAALDELHRQGQEAMDE